MTDFIRPEVRAAFLRWRECIAALLLLTLSIWFWQAGGPLRWIAPVAVLAALALGWIGLQRARFRGSGAGLGSVQVVEGQITYFGPETGGMVAVGELERLILDGAQAPAHWHLHQPGLPELVIPVDAHGADSLFDAFSSLPGLKTERMLSAMHDMQDQAVVIWERNPMRAPHERLH